MCIRDRYTHEQAVADGVNVGYDEYLIETRITQKGGEIKAPVSYTHLRAHETVLDIVCRLLLEKKP